jgi:small subunit ribosomal protein S3
MSVNVIEIKEPDLNAALIGEAIAEQLSKRASFRRTMKDFCEAAMNAGAKGVKVACSGRLAGAEIARRETQKLGSIPLQTLDADVDYATATARTTYGAIGIKVWVYKGKFGDVLEPKQGLRRRSPRRDDAGKGHGGARRRTRTTTAQEGGSTAEAKNEPAQENSRNTENPEKPVINNQ